MIAALRQRGWRQRRRILAVAGVLGIAGLLAGEGVVGLLLYGRLGGVAPGLVVGLAPARRRFADKIAVALLAGVIVDGAFDAVLGIGPTVTLVTILALGAIFLFEAELFNIAAGAGPTVFRARRVVRLPRDRVWHLLVAQAGEPWEPAVASIDIQQGPAGERLRRGVYREGGPMGGFVRYERTVEEDPQRYHLSEAWFEHPLMPEADLSDMQAATGTVLDEIPEGTVVSLYEGVPSYGAYLRALAWLDDMMADHLDHFAAIAEERPDFSFKAADSGF
ncbi:MAG: hypothetical protein ACFBSD_15120 [Paracoccaceae bacterium]